MKELFSALIKAQSMIKNAIKDSSNPHYRSKYADLESVWDAVRDALQKNSLAVLQLTDIDSSGAPVLITRVIHSSGEHLDSRYPLICKDMTDPQKMGSALSYARRYSLGSFLGVISSDDDGNAASNIVTPAPVQQVKPEKKITSLADLFSAHGQQYPDCLETVIGKRVAQWTDTEKSSARQAVDMLRAGKAWDDARSVLVKAVTFS